MKFARTAGITLRNPAGSQQISLFDPGRLDDSSTAPSFGPFIYTGTMISAMAFLLYNLASRHIAMGRISLYSVRQAPFGAVLAALLLGETISAVEFGGMTLGPPMIGKLLGHTQVQTIAR